MYNKTKSIKASQSKWRSRRLKGFHLYLLVVSQLETLKKANAGSVALARCTFVNTNGFHPPRNSASNQHQLPQI